MFFVSFEIEGEPYHYRLNAISSQQAAEFGVTMANPERNLTERVRVEVGEGRKPEIYIFEVEVTQGRRFAGTPA